ncbi:Transcription initiation factor IIA large subunit-like protein [Emericellopsis cladophorae]|uniref:Transcription initiation factor IIA large subunit-like protein n=1 Tax=Emericellopsis cladophorae TaxID=2686198 RepID=A0A9P9Y4X4_9HYPO|nr:Transcription initiation factor IIA large subunit-like protein [Emericellopsis cladophorae]KAI6783288.1 Transcription initiation factor IIA large subunit-like protein [Emericellopsis cladophorae]
MSNQAVGNVYQSVIDEVINSSRVDFEESGIEESVLEMLRQNGIKQEPHGQDEAGPAIKREPGHHLPMPPPMTFGGMDNNVAAHRAAQNLQQQYGERAVNSINAIQQGHHAGHQQQQHQHQHQQGQQGQQVADPQAAYRQQMAAATAAQQHASNGQGHLQHSQTDGAGEADSDGEEEEEDDFDAILCRKNEAGELQAMGRVDIDRILHKQFASKAKAMEGGGLMLPLEEATRHKTMPASKRKGKGVARYDGDDDDEEDDEDAINSDLDDPDDVGPDDDGDEDGLGHMMLCMYDKVQRVKNKWKCTLKDGVLTVNGKEYVFHKATGEYEW